MTVVKMTTAMQRTAPPTDDGAWFDDESFSYLPIALRASAAPHNDDPSRATRGLSTRVGSYRSDDIGTKRLVRI